jgi:hypothetical protein
MISAPSAGDGVFRGHNTNSFTRVALIGRHVEEPF